LLLFFDKVIFQIGKPHYKGWLAISRAEPICSRPADKMKIRQAERLGLRRRGGLDIG
jgi:hypothetical protein